MKKIICRRNRNVNYSYTTIVIDTRFDNSYLYIVDTRYTGSTGLSKYNSVIDDSRYNTSNYSQGMHKVPSEIKTYSTKSKQFDNFTYLVLFPNSSYRDRFLRKVKLKK